MTQEPLFQDPEFRPLDWKLNHRLDTSDKEKLETITLKAAEFPLLYGEYNGSTVHGRLKKILGRINDGPVSENYLILSKEIL